MSISIADRVNLIKACIVDAAYPPMKSVKPEGRKALHVPIRAAVMGNQFDRIWSSVYNSPPN